MMAKSQLRKEKIDLENHLEAEQEQFVNRLWKRMEQLENEKRCPLMTILFGLKLITLLLLQLVGSAFFKLNEIFLNVTHNDSLLPAPEPPAPLTYCPRDIAPVTSCPTKFCPTTVPLDWHSRITMRHTSSSPLSMRSEQGESAFSDYM